MPATLNRSPDVLDSPARVLIVDDSVVARAVIGRALDGSERFVVAGAVGNVPAAMAALATTDVQIILLDVALPGVDGLTALPDLLAAGKGAKVVIVSANSGDGAASVHALALGAADTLVKPSAAEMSSGFAANLIARLDQLVDAPAPRAALLCPIPPSSPTTAIGDDFDVVAIGASTGGIHALGNLLRALPASFHLPIIITQHLPAPFMPVFAAQLAVISGRPCEVATDRMRIRPGQIVLAPGHAHLRCVAIGDRISAIRLSTEPSSSGCLPSVDPMFASLAAIYGPRLLAIVLSGMGRDGTEGARAVRDAGGNIIVQDQASSVVWGMPGAVAAQGLADAILPPEAIGRLVASRIRSGMSA